MPTVREFLEKIKFGGLTRYDEPLSVHTTFRIGGPADALVLPRTPEALAALLSACRAEGVPFFVLGGGANLLVGDGGIRGLVIATSELSEITRTPEGLQAGAGVSVVALTEAARDAGLSGLEFAAGLPGSAGGAVFMNARCYDREFADVLAGVDYIDPRGNPGALVPVRGEWEYKRTPFMPGGRLEGSVITGARFKLKGGDRESISRRMEEKIADRTAKGHFDHPCAGSFFKNNRGFGRPTGRILDELGFRGLTLGTAAVSPKHANIFINPGAATAADMCALMELARRRARESFGFDLEPEVILAGDFGEPG